MLWFGKKFIGVPYVGGTLDRAEEEKLVINTSELDCTTFVEIVTALTRCMSGNGKKDFSDFCRQLQHVRYINGEIAYEKRQHYFTVWISDNAEEGIVTDIQNNPPFTKVQHVSVNWMTTHQQSYKMLKIIQSDLKVLRHWKSRLVVKVIGIFQKSRLWIVVYSEIPFIMATFLS